MFYVATLVDDSAQRGMYALRHAIKNEEDVVMAAPPQETDLMPPLFTESIFDEDPTATPHGYACELQEPGTLCQCPAQYATVVKKIVIRRPMPASAMMWIAQRRRLHSCDGTQMPDDTDNVYTARCTRLQFE
jgi:hypothetical protein